MRQPRARDIFLEVFALLRSQPLGSDTPLPVATHRRSMTLEAWNRMAQHGAIELARAGDGTTLFFISRDGTRLTAQCWPTEVPLGDLIDVAKQNHFTNTRLLATALVEQGYTHLVH